MSASTRTRLPELHVSLAVVTFSAEFLFVVAPITPSKTSSELRFLILLLHIDRLHTYSDASTASHHTCVRCVDDPLMDLAPFNNYGNEELRSEGEDRVHVRVIKPNNMEQSVPDPANCESSLLDAFQQICYPLEGSVGPFSYGGEADLDGRPVTEYDEGRRDACIRSILQMLYYDDERVLSALSGSEGVERQDSLTDLDNARRAG
ncbi:hypothetical protein WG66_000205 [Moniliophthora roreri]|nr:hypothetical protein WG66_000205 [Moniliophthora roreri]